MYSSQFIALKLSRMFSAIHRTLPSLHLFPNRKMCMGLCSSEWILFKYFFGRENWICSVYRARFSGSVFLDQEQRGKRFRESENEYAHYIMENLTSYKETIVKHPTQSLIRNKKLTNISITDLTNFSKYTAVDAFLMLSETSESKDLDLENTLYTELISAVVMELEGINDEKLTNILASLCLWLPTISTETLNFKLLWNALDAECVNRIEKWSINRQLLIADYWFHLRLSRITKYNITMINILVRKRDLLLPYQIVQLFFYMNLQRNVRPRIMHYIESKLNSVLASLKINEVGIVCLGLFKTRTKISNSLVLRNMIQLTSNHISEIDDMPLSAILKQFKQSSKLEHIDDVSIFLTQCSPFVKNWLPVTGIHLVLLGAYIDLYHPVILDSVIERILPLINEVRLKDITKLLFYISKHIHTSRLGEKVFTILINELRSLHRQEEINFYPHCFVSCLLYLAYCGIYPEDLISKALNPSFVHAIQEKSSLNYNQEIITLYYSAEIELPNNKGEKLPIEEIQKILQEFHLSAENAPASFQDIFLENVLKELRKLGYDKQSFIVRRILPYSHFPDIIMCRKRNGNFLPIPKKIEDLSFEKILKPTLGEYQWFCLTLLTKSSYSSDNQVLGLPTMKKRQLTKLGYHVIEIPWFQFHDLSSKRKQDYLLKRLI